VAHQRGILRGMGQRAASGGRHGDLLPRPAGVAHHHASQRLQEHGLADCAAHARAHRGADGHPPGFGP
jgi:hypothetical protein